MNIKKIEKIQVKPIDPKPEQLDLFKAVYAQEYTNAFTFYESIPRFVVARGAQKFIKWNEDGTAAPLRRKFTSEGQQYDLILIPAYVEKDEDTIKAQFP